MVSYNYLKNFRGQLLKKIEVADALGLFENESENLNE